MSHSVLRAGAALTLTVVAFAATACDTATPTTQPSAGTTSAASPSASASVAATPQPSESASASASTAPLPTATESTSPTSAPSGAATRVSSADGVFSVEMPAGWNQNATSDATLSSITLNAPDGGNLQILSVRYSKPQTTITNEFSRQRDAIVQAFPKCTFPKGADKIKESLGGKVDANYRVFTCDSMPFAFAVFTANGPGGEFLVGHDADFGGKADRWKDIVKSVETAKK